MQGYTSVCFKETWSISDVPNSGKGLVRLKYRTEQWDCDFTDYLKKLDAKKPVIMCGDLNVSHTPVGMCYWINHVWGPQCVTHTCRYVLMNQLYVGTSVCNTPL